MVRLEATKFQDLDNDSAVSWAHLSNRAVDRAGELDEEEDIKEGDRVDEVEVGRGVDVGNTVLLITEV